jgi:cold shock CspA family protein
VTVNGAMTWTSSSQQFGFVAPADGSRVVFVCLSDLESRCQHLTRDDKDRAPLGAGAVPGDGPDTRFQDHRLAARVEVRTRYLRGQWAPGFEIAQVVDSGYRVRRPGSLEILPEIVVRSDVRRAGEE